MTSALASPSDAQKEEVTSAAAACVAGIAVSDIKNFQILITLARRRRLVSSEKSLGDVRERDESATLMRVAQQPRQLASYNWAVSFDVVVSLGAVTETSAGALAATVSSDLTSSIATQMAGTSLTVTVAAITSVVVTRAPTSLPASPPTTPSAASPAATPASTAQSSAASYSTSSSSSVSGVVIGVLVGAAVVLGVGGAFVSLRSRKRVSDSDSQCLAKNNEATKNHFAVSRSNTEELSSGSRVEVL